MCIRRTRRHAPVSTDAVFAAGYGSVSRFYEKADLGMKAREYRARGKGQTIGYTSFASPLEDEAVVTFDVTGADGGTPEAKVYVGHYEARITPVADTVASTERDVDPVGACVGMKGTRVQSIIRELRGEKIDIVEYSEDPISFVMNAISPAKVQRVTIVDDAQRVMEVIVEDKQLSLAIGKKGQNVRLAAKLTGWRIDIKSEEEKRKEVEAQFGALEVGDSGTEAVAEAGNAVETAAENVHTAEELVESPTEPAEREPAATGETPEER